MGDLPIDKFKQRIKAVKKISTQLSNIEDRSAVKKVEAGQSSSSDLTGYIYPVEHNEGRMDRTWITVETNFFGNGNENMVNIKIPREYNARSFKMKINNIDKLENKLVQKGVI